MTADETIAALQERLREHAMMALPELMSNISEDCWCAGWLNGLEYDLWVVAKHGPSSYPYGQDVISPEQVEQLRRLSEDCGGWFVFNDDVWYGRRFVPLAEWEALFQARQDEKR